MGWYGCCLRGSFALAFPGWRCLMKKGKSDIWTAIFSAEVRRPREKFAASASANESSSLRRLRLRRSVATGYRTALAAQAALFAALVAIGPGEALAGKNGHGHHPYHGIPNGNLRLAQFERAGAGVGLFAPSVSGASALTPANGLRPPGQPGLPGLRLGHQRLSGPPPVLNGTPGVVLPDSVAAPPQPGNGLAAGQGGSKPSGNSTGASSPSDAAMARIADRTYESAAEHGENGQALPRKLPTCR